MRYIDADKLLDEVHTESGCIDFSMTATDIRKMIREQPTADVVEVVRCKDCRWWRDIDHTCKYSFTSPMCANDYCSHGERKDI